MSASDSILAGAAVGRVARRRHRWISAGLFASGVAACAFGGSGQVVAFVLLLAALLRVAARRTEPIALPAARASGDLVFEGGRVRFLRGGEAGTLAWDVALDQLEQGFSVPTQRGFDVVLEVCGGDAHVIEVDDAPAADALLDAARVAPAHRRVKIRVAPVSFTTAGGCLALVAALAITPLWMGAFAGLFFVHRHQDPGILPAAIVLLVTTLLGALVVLSTLPPTVEIGLDGLAIRGVLRRRFVAMARVSGVVRLADRVRVELDEGRPIELRALARAGGAAAVVELAEAIERVRCASDAQRSDAVIASLLDRGDESFAAWSARVAELGATGGYREVRPSPELFGEVVGDAQAPAARRLGAAVALARSGDAEAVIRVRVAAETTADAELRAALEAASADELTEELLEPLRRRA